MEGERLTEEFWERYEKDSRGKSKEK